jgi:hypothetical protein
MRQLNSEELGNVDGGITLGGFAQGTQAPVTNPATTTGITFNGTGPFPFAGGGGPFPFDGFHHHGFGGLFADPAAREAVNQFLNDPAFESAVTSFTAAHPEYADQLNHVVDFLEHRAEGNGFPFNGNGFPFNGNGFPFNGNGPFNGIPFQGFPNGFPGPFAGNGVPVIGQPLAGTPPTLEFNGQPVNGTVTINPSGNGYTYTYTYETGK